MFILWVKLNVLSLTNWTQFSDTYSCLSLRWFFREPRKRIAFVCGQNESKHIGLDLCVSVCVCRFFLCRCRDRTKNSSGMEFQIGIVCAREKKTVYIWLPFVLTLHFSHICCFVFRSTYGSMKPNVQLYNQLGCHFLCASDSNAMV